MAHAAKYNASASGHLAKHYERAKVFNEETKEWEYIKFKNQDIDPSRTHLNYNLAPEREGGQVAFIRQRTSEVRCLKRADVNVMCSWVITLPKCHPADKSKHVTPNEDYVSKIFFERAYRFMCDRYGEENMISAYVHRDEATDHMHGAFIPVVRDKKRGDLKVSAKDVLTINELRDFQTDLQRHLNSFRDWHFEVLNGATKDGNKTIAELKAEEVEKKVAELENKTISLQGDIKSLEERKSGLKRDIEALQTKKDTLTAEEVKRLKGTKTLTGAIKGISYDEVEALKRTAARVEDMEREVETSKDAAKAAYVDANRKLAEHKAKLDAEYKELTETAITHDNVSLMLRYHRENEDLKRENAGLRRIANAFERAVESIKSIAPNIYRKIMDIVSPEKHVAQREMDPHSGHTHQSNHDEHKR